MADPKLPEGAVPQAKLVDGKMTPGYLLNGKWFPIALKDFTLPPYREILPATTPEKERERYAKLKAAAKQKKAPKSPEPAQKQKRLPDLPTSDEELEALKKQATSAPRPGSALLDNAKSSVQMEEPTGFRTKLVTEDQKRKIVERFNAAKAARQNAEEAYDKFTKDVGGLIDQLEAIDNRLEEANSLQSGKLIEKEKSKIWAAQNVTPERRQFLERLIAENKRLGEAVINANNEYNKSSDAAADVLGVKPEKWQKILAKEERRGSLPQELREAVERGTMTPEQAQEAYDAFNPFKRIKKDDRTAGSTLRQEGGTNSKGRKEEFSKEEAKKGAAEFDELMKRKPLDAKKSASLEEDIKKQKQFVEQTKGELEHLREQLEVDPDNAEAINGVINEKTGQLLRVQESLDKLRLAQQWGGQRKSAIPPELTNLVESPTKLKPEEAASIKMEERLPLPAVEVDESKVPLGAPRPKEGEVPGIHYMRQAPKKEPKPPMRPPPTQQQMAERALRARLNESDFSPRLKGKLADVFRDWRVQARESMGHELGQRTPGIPESGRLPKGPTGIEYGLYGERRPSRFVFGAGERPAASPVLSTREQKVRELAAPEPTTKVDNYKIEANAERRPESMAQTKYPAQYTPEEIAELKAGGITEDQIKLLTTKTKNNIGEALKRSAERILTSRAAKGGSEASAPTPTKAPPAEAKVEKPLEKASALFPSAEGPKGGNPKLGTKDPVPTGELPRPPLPKPPSPEALRSVRESADLLKDLPQSPEELRKAVGVSTEPSTKYQFPRIEYIEAPPAQAAAERMAAAPTPAQAASEKLSGNPSLIRRFAQEKSSVPPPAAEAARRLSSNPSLINQAFEAKPPSDDIFNEAWLDKAGFQRPAPSSGPMQGPQLLMGPGSLDAKDLHGLAFMDDLAKGTRTLNRIPRSLGELNDLTKEVGSYGNWLGHAGQLLDKTGLPVSETITKGLRKLGAAGEALGSLAKTYAPTLASGVSKIAESPLGKGIGKAAGLAEEYGAPVIGAFEGMGAGAEARPDRSFLENLRNTYGAYGKGIGEDLHALNPLELPEHGLMGMAGGLLDIPSRILGSAAPLAVSAIESSPLGGGWRETLPVGTTLLGKNAPDWLNQIPNPFAAPGSLLGKLANAMDPDAAEMFRANAGPNARRLPSSSSALIQQVQNIQNNPNLSPAEKAKQVAEVHSRMGESASRGASAAAAPRSIPNNTASPSRPDSYWSPSLQSDFHQFNLDRPRMPSRDAASEALYSIEAKDRLRTPGGPMSGLQMDKSRLQAILDRAGNF